MQLGVVGVEKVSACSFPNIATLLVCSYLDEQKSSKDVAIGAIKKHFHVIYMEARKANPFVGSCTKTVMNDVDWDFVEKYNEK